MINLFFFHGTASLDESIFIALNGLKCDYPELLYTADLMSKSDRSLLFEKIRNWPHWNLKYLLIICVPKNSGKGRITIWNQEERSRQISLPSQLINEIIDVNNNNVISNPRYNPSGEIGCYY